MFWSLLFGLHEINCFEPRVIVNQYESVLVATEYGANERASYVGMNQSAGIGGLVPIRAVRQSCCSRFNEPAVRYITRLREGVGPVGGDVREAAKAVDACMKSAVKDASGGGRRESGHMAG